MSLFPALLALDAILHGIIIGRFGIRSNQPVFVFMLVYAALAIAVYLSVPNVLWAVLLLTTIGTIGLTVTFNKIARDKRLEMVIWPLNIVIVLVAGLLLVCGIAGLRGSQAFRRAQLRVFPTSRKIISWLAQAYTTK